jgi:hypothetical protein
MAPAAVGYHSMIVSGGEASSWAHSGGYLAVTLHGTARHCTALLCTTLQYTALLAYALPLDLDGCIHRVCGYGVCVDVFSNF